MTPRKQKNLKRQHLEKLRARAMGGEDFQKLAQEFSEAPSLGETKGEYTFTRNGPFTPEFKAAAFSLETGAVSDIVTTPFGFHVLKLLEKIPAQKTDFDKVSKDLKEVLLQQALAKAMPDFFARLKKEAGVEILEASAGGAQLLGLLSRPGDEPDGYRARLHPGNDEEIAPLGIVRDVRGLVAKLGGHARTVGVRCLGDVGIGGDDLTHHDVLLIAALVRGAGRRGRPRPGRHCAARFH